MKTVVQFVKNHRIGTEEDNGRNKIYARSLRKISFVDNRYPISSPQPQHGEHWFVEVVRENQGRNGGCFILTPLRKLEKEELQPLFHGMYEMKTDGDAVIIVPPEEGFWVMSPTAKKAILAEIEGARSMVVDHGGPMWERRLPSESIVEREAKKILDSLSE